MSIWSDLTERLRALRQRRQDEREMDEEIRFHLDMEIAKQRREGHDEREARRRAMLKFGGVERVKEDVRDARGTSAVENAGRDLRYGLRQLRRSPGFAAAVVLTLALGIGANTAIFSVVDTVLFRPLPFANPERLVVVWETDRRSDNDREPASYPDFVDFRDRMATLDGLTAFVGVERTWLNPAGDAERVRLIATTHDFLPMLGLPLVRGRHMTAENDVPNAAGVALLGERFWRDRFGAADSVIGARVNIDGQSYSVIGVVDDRAAVGVDQINAAAAYGGSFRSGERVDFWIPLRASAQQFPRATHPFFLLGRLRPNASVAVAQQDLAKIAADLERSYPRDNTARGVNVEALTDVVLGSVRPAMFVLLAAVALVLLVSCVNVANLLLARGAARAREVAVRTALGAGQRRIAGQFAVEGFLLATLGAVAGLFVAWLSLRAMLVIAPADVPRLQAATLDPRILGFTTAVTLAAAFVFTLVPTLQVRRVDVQSSITGESNRASASRARSRLRAALVVAQLAMAVTLLVSTGIMLRSLDALSNVDPGFHVNDVLKAQYQLPAARYPRDFSNYPHWPKITTFHDEVMRRAAALPGVESVALAGAHPLDVGFTNSFQIVGREEESRSFGEIRVRQVSAGYFATMDVPVLQGRAFDATDDAAAPPVAVINRAAAEQYFPQGNPLGQQLRWWGIPRTIVGVVGNERFAGLAERSPAAVYAVTTQAPITSASVLVRASGDPTQLVAPLRAIVRELDREIALYGAEPLRHTLSATMSERRFTTVLLTLFAALALLLAVVGVHGVLSFTVAQRTPEVGVRIALGATSSDVNRLVVREGLVMAGIGIAIGFAGALAASRVLAGMVYGVSATDPLTFAGVAATMLVVAALASWLPARRATRIDPIRALRAE